MVAYITHFFPVRIPHNNTINNRWLPCFSMCIFWTNSVYLAQNGTPKFYHAYSMKQKKTGTLKGMQSNINLEHETIACLPDEITILFQNEIGSMTVMSKPFSHITLQKSCCSHYQITKCLLQIVHVNNLSCQFFFFLAHLFYFSSFSIHSLTSFVFYALFKFWLRADIWGALTPTRYTIGSWILRVISLIRSNTNLYRFE